MRTSKSVIFVLAALSTLGVMACSASDQSHQQVPTGSVQVALTGISNSGSLYRLRNGVFSITGPTSTNLSTEGDPDATSISLDLAAGDYDVALEPGWFLEREIAGSFETVDAVLISANPTSFGIVDQSSTPVVFQFEASGEVVELGEGSLDLSIAVDDVNCDPGLTECAASCVDTQSDVAHCGGCDAACPTLPASTPACTAGSCTFECLPNRADCDMSAANGCEVDVFNDPNHCGGCGSTCAAPNGTSLCQAGACEVASCNPGFADCDGNPQTGCEVSLDANPACSAATFGGSLSGDTGSSNINQLGTGEQRLRFQVTEDDLSASSARQLAVRFTLMAPAGVSYTLEAGCDGCNVNATGSNVVTLRWEEETSVFGLPTGSDSGRDVFVTVRYAGGSSCAPWSLQAQGNVSGGLTTCSER